MCLRKACKRAPRLVLAGPHGEAQVREERPPLVADEHVSRLHVAVDHVRLVQLRQSLKQVLRNRQEEVQRHAVREFRANQLLQ